MWEWFIGTKIGRWAVGLGAALAAFGALMAMMFLKGKHAQADKDRAKDAEVDAKAAHEAAEAVKRSSDAVRTTHEEVSKMPDAGVQRVGDAVPGTPADWLHQNADRDQTGS